MKAMILAAGRGKRMRALTKDTPKPLLEINGKKLIEIQIDKLIQANFNEIIINVSYLHEQIINFVEEKYHKKLKILFSIEKEPLETAGGIINALNYFDDEPFLVTNSDISTSFNYSELKNNHNYLSFNAHLILVPNPSFKSEGDFGLNENILTSQNTFTYSGIGMFTKKLFKDYNKGEKLKLRQVFDRNIKKNKISGTLFNGHWSDIGTPSRLTNEINYRK